MSWPKNLPRESLGVLWSLGELFGESLFEKLSGTVDGSFEILHSPVEGTVDYPIIYQVFCTSQVAQNFFHQQ